MKARRPQRTVPPGPSRRAPTPLERCRDWFSTRRVLIVFIAKFFIFLAAFHALSLTPCFGRYLPLYLHSVASGANWLARSVGERSEIVNSTLHSGAFGVTVAPECSALEILWFIAAVVLAFPATWGARWLGLFFGAVLCLLLNILRVASLLLVGAHVRSAFDLVHEQLWATLLIFSVTLFVAAWIHWLNARFSDPAS